jgi:hypothetical protein
MIINSWLDYFIAIVVILTAWSIVYKMLENRDE